MWAFENHTPFPSAVGAYRTADGGAFWGLWLAASFRLRAGKRPLFLEPQPPLAVSPVFGPNDRLLHESEKGPPRPNIDLILDADVMQPPSDASEPKRLRVRLGSWEKALTVHPPLRRTRRGRVAPDPDTPPGRVSLSGEDSYGGAGHAANPLGRGHASEGDGDGGTPPVVYAAGYGPDRADRAQPPGTFGPLSPVWPIRRDLAGTYDAAWRRQRAPMLPSDLDPTYWQAAPLDQRLPRPLSPSDRLELHGFDTIDPTDGAQGFHLPHLALECDTRIGTRWHPAEADLQSISVDVSRLTVRHLYHARWPLERAGGDVDVERTVVSLADTRAFRVEARHVGLFRPSHSMESPE